MDTTYRNNGQNGQFYVTRGNAEAVIERTNNGYRLVYGSRSLYNAWVATR